MCKYFDPECTMANPTIATAEILNPGDTLTQQEQVITSLFFFFCLIYCVGSIPWLFIYFTFRTFKIFVRNAAPSNGRQ